MVSLLALKACQVCGASIKFSPGDAEVSCSVCGSEYDVIVHGAKSPVVRVTGVAVLHVTRVVGVDSDPSPPYNPGQSFKKQVWVICDTDYCNLVGNTIKIYDHAGKLIKTTTLTKYVGYPYYTNMTDWLPFTAPTVEGTYTWRAEFPEQAGHKRSERNFTFSIVPPPMIGTSLSTKAEPTEVPIGEQTVISDKLIRTDTGAGLAIKDVHIYWKKPGETVFDHWGKTLTNYLGEYLVKPYIDLEGTYEFYAEFEGDATYLGCESPLVYVGGAAVPTYAVTVKNWVTKKPIAGAEVVVIDIDVVETDENGIADLTAVLPAPGTYEVGVRKDGYKSTKRTMEFPGINQVNLIPIWAIGLGLVAGAAATTVVIAKAAEKRR